MQPSLLPDSLLLLRGVHLELTPALQHYVREKMARLVRHAPRLIRLRIEVVRDQSAPESARFLARGEAELRGPNRIASAATHDAYLSINRLALLLDRILREQTRRRSTRRNDPLGAPA